MPVKQTARGFCYQTQAAARRTSVYRPFSITRPQVFDQVHEVSIKLSQLDSSVERLTTRVVRLEDKVVRLEGKLNGVDERVHAVEKDISAVCAGLNVGAYAVGVGLNVGAYVALLLAVLDAIINKPS